MKKMNNLSELLILKICHDISGPLSGIVTACDILDENNYTMNAGLKDLLQMSATKLVVTTRLLRELYGLEKRLDMVKDISDMNIALSELYPQKQISFEYNYKNSKINYLYYKLSLAISSLANKIIPSNGSVVLNFTSDNNGANNLMSVIFLGKKLMNIKLYTHVTNVTLDNIHEYYMLTLLEKLSKIITIDTEPGKIIYRIEDQNAKNRN